MLIRKKSQGILEYTIMLGAVVAIIVVVMLKKNGIGTHVKDSYDKMGTSLSTTVNDLTTSISPETTSTSSEE